MSQTKTRVRIALLLLAARGQRTDDDDAIELAEQRRLEYALLPFTPEEQQAATVVLAAAARGDGPGLNDVLRLCGLRAEPTRSVMTYPMGRRDVVNRAGDVLLARVTCFEVWPWLAETGRWPLRGDE